MVFTLNGTLVTAREQQLLIETEGQFAGSFSQLHLNKSMVFTLHGTLVRVKNSKS